MDRLNEWWVDASAATRVLAAVVVALVVGLGAVAVWQVSRVSGLQSDLRSYEESATSELATRVGEIESLTEELSAAQERVRVLEQEVASLETSVSDSEARAVALEVEASEDLTSALGDLEESRRALSDALAEKDQAERLIAELTLTYDEEIEAARLTLADSARAFACKWAAQRAIDGATLGSISGSRALSGYDDSDEFAALAASPEIATAMSVADVLGEDRFGLSADDLDGIVVECWQEEDSKINAALYEYQDVFHAAVLDAACTSGASRAYDDRGGFWWTEPYLDWRLSVGNDTAMAYQDDIEERFGSVEEFLAIPKAEIDEASTRCDQDRELIAPKSDGTWNVGSEIQPGTWKAFDVSDCYWARLAVNGDIRDNFFGDGLRLNVNVLSSDGQFEINGCLFVFADP